MSLCGSVGGLLGAVKDKISQVFTAIKIVACLPAFLTSIPGVLGAIAGSAANSIAGLMAGATDALMGIVNSVIGTIKNAVASVVNKVLQLQADLLCAFGEAKEFVDDVENEAKDLVKWLKNEENCKFAASELLKCVAGKLLENLSSQITSKLEGALDFGIDDFLEDLEESLSFDEQIDKWTGKATSQIDNATSKINAVSLW
jgi:uncharacterized protein YjbJ (UPF0337 family)